MHDKSNHQRKQIEIINNIEAQIETGNLNFSTVSQTKDFDTDPRVCLTSVHFPNKKFIKTINREIIRSLSEISPDQYHYKDDSLHTTIKNIRVINDPPNFTAKDVITAKKVFSNVIPTKNKFKIYFYRLLLFPNNLALVGTTDPALDDIILSLNQELKESGISDDKKYANSKYFFSNITLARFIKPISEEYVEKVSELSNSIKLEPYSVNTVTLIKCNASLHYCDKIQTWELAY